jgi:hypothetical protein
LIDETVGGPTTTRLALVLTEADWVHEPLSVAVTVKLYVLGARVEVVLIDNVVVAGEPELPVTELDPNVGVAPAGRPVIVKLAVQFVVPLVPAKVTVTGLYVAVPPEEIWLGLCAPNVTALGLLSMNVVCACETEPTAVRVNLILRSCTSVVNELSEIFPLASAVTV